MKLMSTPPENLQMATSASAVFTMVPILYVLAILIVGHAAPLDFVAGGLLVFYAMAGLSDIVRHYRLRAKPISLWGK